MTLYDAHDRQIPYQQAWDWQKGMVEAVVSASAAAAAAASASEDHQGSSSATLGSLVLLQHPPVYTLGTGATEGHLKFDGAAPPLPLYRTERGGEVRKPSSPGPAPASCLLPAWLPACAGAAAAAPASSDAWAHPFFSCQVTYHGPGQLVLYPILDLRRPPLQQDLHWYLRQLEEVAIRWVGR